MLKGLFWIALIALPAMADDPAILPQDNPSSAPAAAPVEDKRVFGVMPNHRTTEASIPFQPIPAKEKLSIAAKDSFDWPAYLVGGAFAGLYQLRNENPSWGQGLAGYGKRYGSAVGDQVIGNMMTEGIVPAIGHQDPRYFRLGQGSFGHRLAYSLEQIVTAKMDSGRRTFNFSEWGGNGAAVAISNLYYPADQHTVSENVEKLFIACGTDALSNVAKEFWPDVKHYFQHRKERKDQLGGAGVQPAP